MPLSIFDMIDSVMTRHLSVRCVKWRSGASNTRPLRNSKARKKFAPCQNSLFLGLMFLGNGQPKLLKISRARKQKRLCKQRDSVRL
jgi:hypothetical protein